MKLLDLPDELLSTVILEAMWATTKTPSDAPDLLMYERRLSNHPSIQLKKVAYVGEICGRLRRIAQPHLKPPQLWADVLAGVKRDSFGRTVIITPPTSLLAPSIKAIAFTPSQAAVLLPQIPSETLEQLTDVAITMQCGKQELEDTVFSPLTRCKRLAHLDVQGVAAAKSTRHFFKDIASIPTLQSLRLQSVEIGASPRRAIRPPLDQPWSAPLLQLVVVWVDGATWDWVVRVMERLASTLQVVSFYSPDHQQSLLYPAAQLDLAFPHLWRLDIGYGIGAHPRFRDNFLAKDSTQAGRSDFAPVSPLDVWKAAPRLEYFDCSERIVVKTQQELDEVDGLRKRDPIRRLRLKLETWEGEKRAGWSKDRVQELVVG